MGCSLCTGRFNIFRLPYGQLFSYGGALCPPRFKSRFGWDGNQSRNSLLKVIGIDRLDEVRLRSGAQSLLYVTLIGCG
jgi:hypothetical protein